MFYYLKKMLGLASYADEIAKFDQTWRQAPSLIGGLTKSVSVVSNFVSSTFSQVGGLLSSLPGAQAIIPAGKVLTSSLVAAGSTFPAVQGTLAAKTVVVTKTIGLLGAAAATATATVNTTETVNSRVNQLRAVAADTLRHPINLDKALNPAYHGKRDQVKNNNRALTANYYQEENGKNYELTPFIGYEGPTFAKPTYKHLKPKPVRDKSVNLIAELPRELAIDYTNERELNPALLVNLIDEERLSPLEVNFFEGRDVTDEELLEFELAQDYVIEEIRAEFEESVGGYITQGQQAILATHPTTELAEHGIEFIEVEQERTITQTVVTCDDCVVPDPNMAGHFKIIDILGEESFTETFKVQVAVETATKYLESLASGQTNVGPATFLHSLEQNDVRKVIVDSVSSRTNYAKLIEQALKDTGFGFADVRKSHRIVVRRPDFSR